MKPAEPTARLSLWVRRMLAVVLLFLLPLAVPLLNGQDRVKDRVDRLKEKKTEKTEEKKADPDAKTPTEKAAKKPAPGVPAGVEVQFIDDSIMKMTVRDERIEMSTPYGKLLIPAHDIERIEFAFRIPEDVARRIETAIADLGKSDFHRREAASAELRELRQRAYPALLKAEKSSDPEVAHRARELLEQVRVEVPEERLQFRTHNVVYTEESKFTGRLTSAALRVHTWQFGEQQLKLSDVRDLRSQWAAEPEPANVQADPGNMTSFQGQVGKVHVFRVTGGAATRRAAWRSCAAG